MNNYTVLFFFHFHFFSFFHVLLFMYAYKLIFVLCALFAKVIFLIKPFFFINMSAYKFYFHKNNTQNEFFLLRLMINYAYISLLA